jgi:hypothetical protein
MKYYSRMKKCKKKKKKKKKSNKYHSLSISLHPIKVDDAIGQKFYFTANIRKEERKR